MNLKSSVSSFNTNKFNLFYWYLQKVCQIILYETFVERVLLLSKKDIFAINCFLEWISDLTHQNVFIISKKECILKIKEESNDWNFKSNWKWEWNFFINNRRSHLRYLISMKKKIKADFCWKEISKCIFSVHNQYRFQKSQTWEYISEYEYLK